MQSDNSKRRMVATMAKILRSFEPYKIPANCCRDGISPATKELLATCTDLDIDSVIGVFASPIKRNTQEWIIFTLDGCVFYPACKPPCHINYLSLDNAKVRRYSLTLGFHGGRVIKMKSRRIADFDDFLDTILMCKLVKEHYCSYVSYRNHIKNQY